MEINIIGMIVIPLLLFLVQDSKDPTCINFLTTPNPKMSFEAKFNDKNELERIRFSSITVVKSISICLTCVSIMAVDYPPLFPRFLCKTEDYGWSLMDVGVSSVVVTSGLSNRLIVQHRTSNKKNIGFVKELIAACVSN